MNVLITGGAGFIGYHLACYHARLGDRVHVIDSLFKTKGCLDPDFDQLTTGPNVFAHFLDLTHPISGLDLGERLDIVYHLAVVNGTQLFYEIPYDVARINLLSTINVFDWVKDRSVGRIVYTSTSEVYAGGEPFGLLPVPTPETVPVVFAQPTLTRFSYGASKFMGEFLCLQFGRVNHIPATVIRYHNIYGPRMGYRHVIPEFILRAQRRESPFTIFGGGESRAFCHVDDAVCATHLVAIKPETDQEIVHVGNSTEEITMQQLAETIMSLMNIQLPLEERGRRSGSVSRRCPDLAKLRRLTGFEAGLSLRQGLPGTIEWYLAHPA